MCNERTHTLLDMQTADALRAENARLRAALQPFAQAFQPALNRVQDREFQKFLDRNEVPPRLTMAAFRHAYEALTPLAEQKFRD